MTKDTEVITACIIFYRDFHGGYCFTGGGELAGHLGRAQWVKHVTGENSLEGLENERERGKFSKNIFKRGLDLGKFSKFSKSQFHGREGEWW